MVAGEFGWDRDNTIGSTLQPNARCDSWVEFLRDARLGYQLDLARDNGIASRVYAEGQQLLERLPGEVLETGERDLLLFAA